MRFGSLAGVAAFVLVAAAAPVAAQPNTQRADELFNQGRELLDAGKFKQACIKFQQSLDLDDVLGTRLNLALCFEKRGKVKTAVAKFEDTARRADGENQADSAKVAREHADALRGLIPKLTVKQTGPVPGQRVVITRPGEPDLEVTGAAAVELDPTDPSDPDDRIVVRATAPGYRDYSSEPATVAAKASPTVVVPALEKVPDDGGGPVTGPTKSKRKLIGIITASGGVALMGVAAIVAYTRSNALHDHCFPSNQGGCAYGPPDGDGNTELDTGMLTGNAAAKWRHLHIYATGLFIAGVAAVGAGAVLFLTAPRSVERNEMAVVPTVDPDGAGIAVLGRF